LTLVDSLGLVAAAGGPSAWSWDHHYDAADRKEDKKDSEGK
jgi:hypothetical protein